MRRRWAWWRDMYRTISPRVTPNPEAAATLERARENLEYSPRHKFHKDTQQPRKAP